MPENEKVSGKGSEEAAPGDAVRVEGEGIDVAEVMRRIEERAAGRPEAPEYRERSIEELERSRSGTDQGGSFSDPLQELLMAVPFAKAYGEVSADYPIGSRRKGLGPLIVLVKKVMRKLMRPYMEAVFQQQREFNRQVVQIIDNLNQLIVRDRVRANPGRVDRLAFAQRWAPPFEEAAGQLKEAAALFQGRGRVLELWSGRGEFLHAALDGGLEVLGVEGDPALAAFCQERELPVLCADPLDYLEGAPMKSLPAVFVRELGERGTPQELRHAVALLADRLEREGLAVFLNHRPTSFFGSEAAFRDPGILRLVHPQTLAFLLEEAGFSRVEVRPYPTEDGERAKALAAARKAMEKLEKDLPGIVQAWEEFTAPALYLVEAGR
jgi:hypothetical protein